MKTSFFALSFTALGASAHLVGRDVRDSSNTYVHFCAGSKSKRPTTEQIAYKGNTGTEEDYGCNIMTVSKTIAPQYEYTATFNNVVTSRLATPNVLRQVDSSSVAAEESGLYVIRQAPELEKDRSNSKRRVEGYKRNSGIWIETDYKGSEPSIGRF
ncbi:hypothetical protein EDB80DRAFT_680992 [Ilyonectria destructans]|nr:hypothetical protein EDB80DRAFT_680992 [Ilyonectria destructans]